MFVTKFDLVKEYWCVPIDTARTFVGLNCHFVVVNETFRYSHLEVVGTEQNNAPFAANIGARRALKIVQQYGRGNGH